MLSAMSFREKSAWAMGALVAAAGSWYFIKLGAAAWTPGAAPPLGLLVRYVFGIIIGSIAVQTLIVVLMPRDADAPADERERAARRQAGHWSGELLALGAILSLLWFLAHGDGTLLFHSLFAALIVSQVADSVLEAWLLRRGF